MTGWDNEVHSVYVIGCAESAVDAMRPDKLIGPVKVGISGNVYSRVASIQTACPFRVVLAWTFDCPTREIARHIERAFHDTQKPNRLHGEWFSLEPLAAVHLVCIAYRTSLRAFARSLSPYDYEATLGFSGVSTVEKRFHLLTPEDASNGSHTLN